VFQIVQRAISREKQIKGWSRAKKEALISGDYLKLQALAESKKGVNNGSWFDKLTMTTSVILSSLP
jgi:hypothetical protein